MTDPRTAGHRQKTGQDIFRQGGYAALIGRITTLEKELAHWEEVARQRLEDLGGPIGWRRGGPPALEYVRDLRACLREFMALTTPVLDMPSREQVTTVRECARQLLEDNSCELPAPGSPDYQGVVADGVVPPADGDPGDLTGPFATLDAVLKGPLAQGDQEAAGV